eukprot:CAMPEP_0181459060 /NCGR_PEP_ID=MMETSP1110-20121109/32632_1 /TAXON_ID=174948 /ORGANISM="Symbiodinium sp., Strain CCMP421" /LENGTH=882 /DNA_ID=CAMNT_0023583571 /DNA_START=53 /DNA_END=2701 /DNA_ORIENTATION=-
MGKGGRSKFNTLYHARSKLTDDDLPNLGLSQESTDYEEVDISQNLLTSRGLKTVVKFCCRCTNLRIFKAYKNEIDDTGAYQLAKLLEKCTYMEEVHLSHNRLTAKGVKVIVQAAEQHRSRTMSPLWLRLEQNQVSSAPELLRYLCTEYSVCGRGDERNCTSRHCYWKRKVHVPFLYMQREDWKEETSSSKYWQHAETYDVWPEENWSAEAWPDPSWKGHSSQAATSASYNPAAKWKPTLERAPGKPHFIDTVQELFEHAEHAEHEEKWVDKRWEPVDRKKWKPEAAQDIPADTATAVQDDAGPQEDEVGQGLLRKLLAVKDTTTSAKRWAATGQEASVLGPDPKDPVPDTVPEAAQDSVLASDSVEAQEGESELQVEARSGRKTRRAKKKNKISKMSADSPEEGRSRSASESLETVSTWDGGDSIRLSSESAASSAGSSARASKKDSPDEEEREAGDVSHAEGGASQEWGSMNGQMLNLKLLHQISENPRQEELTARLERALEADKLMISVEDRKQVKSCLTSLKSTITEDLEPEQQWSVEIFGSMRTGFGTKGCDLDVVIVRANAQDRESNVQGILMKLRDQLEAMDGVKIKDVILSARVPILKLEYSGRDVDISVNNTKALMNSRLLAAYAELDPLIPQFGVAVKLWAKDAKLCGAPDGHLSSYAFILMALYFLQVASGDELPCLQDGLADSDLEDEEKLQQRVDEIKASGWKMESGSLWILLAGFFAFYGGSLGPTYQYEPFNWGQEVISVRLGKRARNLPLDHELLSELKGRTQGHLHIEDPVEHSRNLRDVLWMHPKNHEKQLQDEISWMDQLCREQVRQQIMCQWPAFPGTFSDFPPFPLAQAMPWGNGFMGGSLNLKGKGRFRGGKFGRQVRKPN